MSATELLRLQRQASTADERDRWFVVRILTLDPQRSRGELARELGRGINFPTQVVRRYNQHGPEAIHDHRKGRAGQPPVLNAALRAALDERLQQPPDDGGEWTSHKVAEWIAYQTGRTVDQSTAWHYLKRLGYSRQQGRPMHPKAASEAEQLAQQKKSMRWFKSGNSSTQTNESSSGVKTKRGMAPKASSVKPG